MSTPTSSIHPHLLDNENHFASSSNPSPLLPSRPPLNSIPDPSQYPLQQFHPDFKEKPVSSKSFGTRIPEPISSAQKTPKLHARPKSTNSEPNSAQTTPSRTRPRVCTGAAASPTFMRLPSQFSHAGGRGDNVPRLSRGISMAITEQLLADVPHFELDEDPLFWNDHNVQVLIRIRPLNNTELISQGYGRCLRQETAKMLVWLGHPETRFTFDHIACESISQEKLFRVAGLPMVENCMSGYNSCMFAYGQTGSGKTYTMMGEIDKMDGKLGDDCGITPRIFEYLFTRITKEEESRKHERLTYSCKCSFLEIYNEQITDLLEPSSTNLQLREDLKKGVYVENLTEFSVRTVNDVLKLLQQGAANRKIAATHMNSESSRSHSVFTCIIESRWEKDSMAHLRFGRLNLVDLAGSERQKSSGAEGDRLKEAANINKSLSTLGLVIMSLVDLAQGKHRHVPYRDSRLTFLLQDSLGGNSKTTIIANVSPSTCNANETLSTLKFAQRAKLIQNNAKINEDASGGVTALQQQIQQLKDQLSYLMKHQHASTKLINFVPRSIQCSLGNWPESYNPSDEINEHYGPKTPKGGFVENTYLKATLRGALRREKLAEAEARGLKAEIEHLNRLAHQREQEAQRTKMMVRFREEKIKRLEVLLDGLISADKFYLDENNALKEENMMLRAKTERNSEVTHFTLENIRLREQIRLFQDFYERGERETLLSEISELRHQLLESLEVEKSFELLKFSPMKGSQEPKVDKELERCMDMNSKLIREVDELRRKLENRMTSSQNTCDSIGDVLLRSDSVDELTSNEPLQDEVTYEKNDEKAEHILNLQSDNIHKQLMDAQSLIETMKQDQFQLIKELESAQTENQRLMKMLDNSEVIQRELVNLHQDYRKQSVRENRDPTVSMEGSEHNIILDLQAKLEKLSKDLKEAEILNRQYMEDHATQLSEDHQTELIRGEVEMETTRTIIHLQEEIDRLQSEYQVCLCSMAEQNLSLRNSVAAKEDELRDFCAEWERAILELTTFLIDGSRSLGDASRQIKSISFSFPNVNDLISEHIERAAEICIEKEETILLLQKSLEDAQNTVMEMEQKLYSLKGATIALTEFQQPEKSLSREETQWSSIPTDSTIVKLFPEDKPMSKKGRTNDNQPNTGILLDNRISDYCTSILRGTVDENLPSAHTKASAIRDVDIELAGLVLAETEDAVNGCCADAETYWSMLNSEIHNAFSFCRELVQNLLQDVSYMRKDIQDFKRNRRSLQVFSDMIPSCLPIKHENQLLMLQHFRNELVEVNNRLSSLSSCFYKVMNIHIHGYLDSVEGLTETGGQTTDCSSSCTFSSFESVDNDDRPSSTDRSRWAGKITEQTLDLDSEEGSNLICKRAILLLVKEFRKAYETFVKLKNNFMAVLASHTDLDSEADILSLPELHALEKLKEQGGDGHHQPTSERAEAGVKNLKEFSVEEKHSPRFFAKFEETSSTIEEADYMLKAMVRANKNAYSLTTFLKQAVEKLMTDKASLSAEIKQLKSSVLLRNGEKEVLQDETELSLRGKANKLSLFEEYFIEMQTCIEELYGTSYSEAIQIVEEMQTFFYSLRSSLEDVMVKALQNDIIIFVLQCQIGEYSDNLRRLDTFPGSHRSTLQEHCLLAGNVGLSHVSRVDKSALQPLRCENMGYQIEYVLRKGVKELAKSDTVDKNFELKRELERKEVLLKGLLFDFSVLQEFASHRKDIKDELEKLIIAMSKVQHELQIKSVVLDEVLVQNTKLEGRLLEAEQALLKSNSELDQTKGALKNFSEQNVEMKDLLKDLYLKNSEAEQLLEDQREAMKSLEREIIRVSSGPERQLVPSLKEIEDALTELTAQRDQLVEKVTILQEKLSITSALADENQAIAAEARQESETSKMYAEQKEEEVKILERSVEELESTINVLEKKVHEMEEEVEKHRLIRDSLELELQALRHRLLTVEGLTESMVSENSNTALLEERLSRSLETNEAHSRIRFLEDENARQAKEIRQFKDYISELVLHAEAQAHQYQHKYKTLEAMLHEVKTDLSNVSAAPTLETADKTSARTRGSSSPFRCIAGLIQQMNQEKDQELSTARLRIEELQALAASRYKEVCMLNTRLATAESMTHDVIRDLLSVKLDISNYANIVDQHQLQKITEEAQHYRQEFVAMERENVNLRSQIDDLLEERERYMAEISKNKADQLANEIFAEQLQERDKLLIAQNHMLKMDKSNLQKRVAELDDMVKKLFSMQDHQPLNQEPLMDSLLRPFDYNISERLAHSQKVLSTINSQLAQYHRPEGGCPDDRMDRRHSECKFRKQRP
ncbi:kinesin-like protein KIN-12C isoform X1 [Sesamum indicum]|uniref:Kinesin-like protein KIN-12C isoform X1 n=1 Tax=Sesamum indicum TaxID=4182 RepID=A0A6I9UJW3_SESIN|nr:kinesin-like protein KIN-12C isoform X1 [Sesamum indicum]